MQWKRTLMHKSLFFFAINTNVSDKRDFWNPKMQNGRNRILCELYIFNVLGNILLGRKAMTNLDIVLKSRNTTLLRKVKTMVFPVVKCRCRVGPQKGWVLKNWCLQIVVLAKTLESPMDNKEIDPVHPKGNQPWLFIERTDAEAEAPVLWAELTHGKRPWCWGKLKAKGEEGRRGRDG